MGFIATIIAFVSLLMIAYQDFTSRSVQWIYFPLLALSGMFWSFSSSLSPGLQVRYTLCNLGFLVLQFLLLKAYLFVRFRQPQAVIGHRIGSGDLLFLIAASTFFSPLNFIVFYIVSLFFAIGIYGVGRILKKAVLSIPLAGYQAVCLLLFIGVAFWLKYSLLQDDWLMFKIMNQ